MDRLGSIEQILPSFVVFGGLSLEGRQRRVQGGQLVPGGKLVACVKRASAMQSM
jgi:hypothetical protein